MKAINTHIAAICNLYCLLIFSILFKANLLCMNFLFQVFLRFLLLHYGQKLSAVTEYNELRKIIMNDYLLQQLQHLN